MILVGKRMGWPFRVTLEFKLADLWVGAFYDRRKAYYSLLGGRMVSEELHVWICLLPCLPIHVIIPWRIS
jgi:hypothetical protein